MYRYESPQKNRYREFIQAGAELIGTIDDFSELQILKSSINFLDKLNIKAKLNINTIGSIEERKLYIKELESYFKKNKNNLSKESNEKIGKNTLRILDSNDPFDSEIIDLAPVIYQFLDEDTLNRYENLKHNLKNENIEYVENSKLVRGLDYYNDLTFEFVYKATVLGGGGRYDKLAESLKLGNSAGVGVAFGVDRIINCINYVPNTKKIMLIGQNFDDIKSVSKKLDKSGIKYFLPIRKSKENTQYKEAIKNNVDYVINCTEKTIKNPKNSESFEFNIRNLKKLI